MKILWTAGHERARPFDLSGQTALVTGCSRGIGKAAAVALAAAGADIVGVSASLGPRARSPLRSRRTAAASARYRCDLADRAAVYELVADVRREAEIDILVNNAGTIARAPAAEHPDEFWDRVLEVNLSAQFVLSRELGRDMLARGRGKIVFVASLLSFQGGITVPGYTASKSAIAGLTKALANEWAGRGVNVNAVAPGYVRTDNTQALREDPDPVRADPGPHSGGALGGPGGHRRADRLPQLAGRRLRPRGRPGRRRGLAWPLIDELSRRARTYDVSHGRQAEDPGVADRPRRQCFTPTGTTRVGRRRGAGARHRQR